MAKVYLILSTSSMMVNGKTIINMEKELTKINLRIMSTLENSKRTTFMETVN